MSLVISKVTSVPIIVLLLALTIVNLTVSQFPIECTDSTSLTNRVCCPNPGNGAGRCGENHNRGRCVSLAVKSQSNNQTHKQVRNAWPFFYKQVCKCNHNYAGHDCSRCKYGFFGKYCEIRLVRERRPISQFTDEEWLNFIKILNMIKTYDSGYFVFTEEPVNVSDASVNLTNLTRSGSVKLYDMFVWLHHYPTKDTSKSKINFVTCA